MTTNVDITNPATEFQTFASANILRNAFTAEPKQATRGGGTMTSKTEPNIPIARNNLNGIQTGILTEKQKLWTRAKPNERNVENPVLKKLQNEIRARRAEKSDSYYASQEVRGLSSDLQGNEHQGTTRILERIQTNRKERHKSILEGMFQELALVNSELEPQIVEACSTVKEYLDDDQTNVLRKMKLLEKNEDLINFTSKELNEHWESIEHHSLIRQSWIEELDITLSAIETDRATLIEEIYKAYTQKLARVAHLMPPDVHKLMEDECLATNDTLLANKRYCADLIRKLKMSDMERERKLFYQWENRIADWKRLRTEIAIKSFNMFMTSPNMIEPPNIQRAMKSLVTEQKKLNERRMELFKMLTKMRPPGLSKASVYQWQNSLTSITEQLDKVHEKYHGVLRFNFDKVVQDCEEELARVKALLFNENVCLQDEIEIISTEQLLPLVGEKKARYDYELEKYEKYTDEITAGQKQMFRMLFKYIQGAAQIWDAHEIGLTKEERELQERLDKNRKEHDTQNQIKEAKFDIVMDRMRQDASEEALAMSLKQSLEMLDDIKKSYHDFHGLQIKTAKEYPSLVDEEVKGYEATICEFFNVSRSNPKKLDKKEQSNEDMISKGDEDGMEKIEECESTTKTSFIKLSSGIVYQINKEKDETYVPPDTTATTRTNYTFLTEDLDEAEVMPYVSSFEITEDLMKQVKEDIRKEFLEHVESWKNEAKFRAESVMTAKIEELNNELDLRLHLHDPRANRAEKDVHNVRAAELVLHRDRVTQHCKGILTSLSTFKSRFSSMIQEHDIETEKFKDSVESLENTFVSATKSHELLSIKDEVANQLDEYMKVIRASLRKFRQDLDEMLNNLRNSNARFRRMLKIFSEGGNFCPEEVDEFRKKLEQMASKIDNAEGSMMAELEGMETKRLDAAHECSGKLEERFKYHLFDLTFLEKISRWLTNVQVKIKSEVADSNSQSLIIAKIIATFDRRIDAVLRPNLDREQINAGELHETLMPILEKFHERVRYLDCAAYESIPSSFAEMQVKPPETNQNEIKFTSKRSRKQKGSDSSLTKSSKSKLVAGSRASLRRLDSEQRPTTVPATKAPSKASLLGKVPSDTDGDKLAKIKSASGNRRNSNPKLSSKFDKKYLIFGDDCEEMPDHFLTRITKICRAGLEGLLLTSDMYYRQKGNRVATRPTAIHDNFDLCAESLAHRLQSYQKQAEEYHNTCIQELHAQVETIGKSLLKFPSLIFGFMQNQHLASLKKNRNASKKEFLANFESLEKRKREHQILLRPTLGHPNNRIELNQLKEKEETRRTELIDLIEIYSSQSKEIQRSYARDFVEALNQLTDTLLRQFDFYLTKDDIQRGKIIPKPKTEKQLLREKMNSATTEEPTEKLDATKIDWKTLSIENLINESENSKDEELINIRKLTKQHEAVIEARNNAFSQCCRSFTVGMKEINEEAKMMTESEMKWNENWNRSIHKILQLY